MTAAQEIEKLLNDWLKGKTTLREVNGSWVEITTPYLDRHNDALQIYARAEDGGYPPHPLFACSHRQPAAAPATFASVTPREPLPSDLSPITLRPKIFSLSISSPYRPFRPSALGIPSPHRVLLCRKVLTKRNFAKLGSLGKNILLIR